MSLPAISQQDLQDILKSVIDPNTGRDLVSSKVVRKAEVLDGRVTIEVVLPYPARSQVQGLQAQIITAVQARPGVVDVVARVTWDIVPREVQRGLKPMPNVNNIIAVASGKGGVGKSTTAVNLALALAAEGARVGILDADVYGPSIPMMLGISGKPSTDDGKSMNPLENFGLQTNSIGFMIDPDTPMIWRGPMATQALEQLLRDTRWHQLDYLIVDMPPGTGDIQLTLAQKVPLTGAVIVTTPQDIALLDARKGLKMFEKVNVPILGIIENMAVHVCSQCGHAEHIFGQGGGQTMAQQYGVPYLGALPLDIQIREQADRGRPTVVAAPDSDAANRYKAIARQVALKISERAKDTASKFPTIVVKNG